MGTPDQVREFLERFERAGVDQVIFVLQAGKNRHEHICESLELFGREVMPAFEDHDKAQVKQKADRLAPAIEAAMARKAVAAESEPPPPLPADFTFSAMPSRWADESGSEEMKEWLEHFAENRAKEVRPEDLGVPRRRRLTSSTVSARARIRSRRATVSGGWLGALSNVAAAGPGRARGSGVTGWRRGRRARRQWRAPT